LTNKIDKSMCYNSPKLRIALVTNNFIPELGSASDLFYQLAKGFNQKDIVDVFTFEPRYYKLSKKSLVEYSNNLKNREKVDNYFIEELCEGIHIYRLSHVNLIYNQSYNNSKFKMLEHLIYPFMLLKFISLIKKYDVVLVYSPPLILGFLFSLFSRIFSYHLIVNVQDIHPQAAKDLSLINNVFILHSLYILEKCMYSMADKIIVHSSGNKDYLLKNNRINKEKISAIYNVTTVPTSSELIDASFKRLHNLVDKFVVVYAGTMSYSQDLETVIKAADLLRDYSEIMILLVGEGPQRVDLINLIKQYNLSNVKLLPYQIGSDYWKLLFSSDLCLVSLKQSGVTTPVVPRKLQDIMAAGKPVLANVPLNGDVPRIISKAKCGIYVSPECPEALKNAILYFFFSRGNAIQFGINARKYALENFTQDIVMKKYYDLFKGDENV